MNIHQKTSAFPLRRQVIKALGGALLAGVVKAQQCATLSSPSLTEGPYFVDEDLIRTDIRVDPSDGSVQAGYPLSLAVNVSQLNDCQLSPLTGAYVDIWHCNALGVYSDVAQQGATGKKFLRGYQPTDRHGNANFLTIYPGWYGGRAVHVHFKIRTEEAGRQYAFTSQLYFDDAFSERVFAVEPYASRGRRWLRNADDGIFHDGGKELLLAPTPEAKGYAATFDVALQV